MFRTELTIQVVPPRPTDTPPEEGNLPQCFIVLFFVLILRDSLFLCLVITVPDI